MDPLSIATGIGSICGTTVKLMLNLSEFIDSVQQAPKEVQALSNELASLYAGCGHIRVAVQAPRVSGYPEKWKDDFDKLMKDCEDNLKQVQILIDKAKITEISGTSKQVWKSVKFVFKAKQVLVVNRRIVLQNGILSNLLAALNETRGNHIEKRLEDIHEKVNELMATRANVREVLVVLENQDEDSQEAEFVLSDRRTNQGRQPSQVNNENSPDDIEPVEEQTINEAQNTDTDFSLSYPDVTPVVIAATKPCASLQKTLDTIKTKVWTIKAYLVRPYGQTEWRKTQDNDFVSNEAHFLQCRLHIRSDGNFFSLQFYKDGDLNTTPVKQGYVWSSGEATLEVETVTILAPSWFGEAERAEWIDDAITFSSPQDAKDFHQYFNDLCLMVQQIRSIRNAALVHINLKVSPLRSYIERDLFWIGIPQAQEEATTGSTWPPTLDSVCPEPSPQNPDSNPLLDLMSSIFNSDRPPSSSSSRPPPRGRYGRRPPRR